MSELFLINGQHYIKKNYVLSLTRQKKASYGKYGPIKTGATALFIVK